MTKFGTINIRLLRSPHEILFLPVHAREILRVKQLAVERNVRAQFRVFFSRYSLAVNYEDNFRRHPATAQLLVPVELRLLRLRAIAAAGANHAHKVEILLVDPKLRRVQISNPCTHDVDCAALPGVLALDGKIKPEPFQFFDRIGHWQPVDIKAENHQGMDIWTI